MVVVQDGYQAYTKHGLDPQASVGSEAYCISAVATNCVPLPDGAVVGLDEKGNFLVDMSKVDPAVPAVGLKDNTAYFNESNPAMVAVSKVPGMQAMAIFHDTWTVDWKSDLMVKASILPAIVLTYVGTTAPFFDKLETTAVERSLNGSLGKTEPVGHANPNAITVNPLRVVDSAVSFPEKKGYTVIALERRNAKPWCSGQEEGLLKTHTKLGDFYRCLRKENGGQITAKGPNINTDYACRVLTTASGLTELREASLFDPDACELPFENRLLSVPVGGAGRWYRADARAAPTMTAAK